MVTPWLREAGSRTIDAVFPGRCLLCGEWLLPAGEWSPLCRGCAEGLMLLGEPRCRRCGIELISEIGTCLRCRTADFAFDSNIPLFANGRSAKRLLSALKFGGRTRLARFFAAHVSRVLAESYPGGTVIVPAPPRRRRGRPDAVALVARALQKTHGRRVLHLLRRAAGVQQKSLDYERRKANLRGRISLLPEGRRIIASVDVVLLDDVFTTGATLDACARVLREAGCGTVNAVTLVIEE